MLHQVGVGALGPVFRTYEPTRDRLVAVKVFRLDITPEQAQSLADELATSADAGLFHPSIVEPIAAGIEGTVAYRADEYVAAETLDVAMRHYAPAPIEKVLPLVTQLAGAIDFARSAGVGHGALHPRDIFVTPDEARASGFGVVEALERVGMRAPVRRPYSAPERIAGGRWGAPADVFSLAAITYELLSGRRPSGTGSQLAPVTTGAHAAAVDAVITRAMHDDPARRYPSALAFVAALDAAARGEGAVAAVPPAAASDEEEAAAAALPAQPDEYDEPEFDDIAAERDEDEAHALFALDEAQEREAHEDDSDRSLFDDEAVEDLALDAVATRDTEQFADEFVAASASGSRRPADVEEPAAAPYEEAPVVLREYRSRSIWSYVIPVTLALLVGFAAGHAVGKRGATEGAPQVSQETNATTGQADAPARPFSEQAVTPSPAPQPVTPPEPVAEPAQPTTGAPVTTEVPLAGSAAPVTKPAPPVAAAGTVSVRSTPAGAAVTVDGEWRGRTPLTVEKLSLGRHRVRVVQPGYATASEDVTLSSRTPTRALSFSLRRTPARTPVREAAPPAAPRATEQPQAYTGAIYVDSRPRGARVLINGKLMGTTPVRIPDVAIGSHVVRLQLADHRDWTTSTRVTAGQESRVTGSLEQIR